MNERESITGVVLDDRVTLTLHEVCEVCGTEEAVVIEMVQEGVVEPVDKRPDAWIFTGVAVSRIRTALRLQHDLHLNLPGAALALELLEEIRALKARRG